MDMNLFEKVACKKWRDETGVNETFTCKVNAGESMAATCW